MMYVCRGADEHCVEETLLKAKKEEADDAKREMEYHENDTPVGYSFTLTVTRFHLEVLLKVEPPKVTTPPKPSVKPKTEFDMFSDDTDLPQVGEGTCYQTPFTYD